jgi:hypothetical protein
LQKPVFQRRRKRPLTDLLRPSKLGQVRRQRRYQIQHRQRPEHLKCQNTKIEKIYIEKGIKYLGITENESQKISSIEHLLLPREFLESKTHSKYKILYVLNIL